jgi:hypothetical protein
VLRFLYVGIYWNNHHHLLHTIHRVTGGMLWANLHVLFWLSQIPFTTGWMGENHFSSVPLALYGCVLLMCVFAWWLLQTCMVRVQGPGHLRCRLPFLQPGLEILRVATPGTSRLLHFRHVGHRTCLLPGVHCVFRGMPSTDSGPR